MIERKNPLGLSCDCNKVQKALPKRTRNFDSIQCNRNNYLTVTILLFNSAARVLCVRFATIDGGAEIAAISGKR